MGLAHSPKIVTDGLILYTDMNNSEKSFRGAPTTNIHDNSMGIYNNVPGHVTAALVSTSETYRGAVVWRLTLTPTTATGVSYLTAGNNPGIGIVTNGGGGLANRYTGHAIFYKTTVPMHSTPLFTNYSNIAGWGAGTLGSNRSVPMGDGWARGEVIWYDTVTRTDGKYWAINPATATINVPIVVLWAGPFKEDRNDSDHVAAYTTGTRSSAQALLDLTNRNTVSDINLTYSSNRSFSFNGSSNFIRLNNNTALDVQTPTVEVWVKTNALNQNGFWFEKGSVNSQYALFQEGGSIQWRMNIGGITNLSTTTASFMNTSNWFQVVGTYTSGSRILYINGVQVNSDGQTGTIATNASGMTIGSLNSGAYFYNGNISVVRVYNKALSAQEVRQNFNAHRGRYGI